MKRAILGIAVAGIILALLIGRVDLPQLGEALWSVRIDLLVVGLAIRIVVMWIKAVRWALTIQAVTSRPVSRAFSASMIGFAGNVLLPARLGELARVSVIDKHNQVGRPLALTTVGITQLFDLLFLVGYFLLTSAWATSQFTAYRWPIGLLGLLIVLTFASLMVLQQKFQYFRSLLRSIRWKWSNVLFRRFRRHVDLFIQGIGVLGKGHVVGRVLLLTVAVWGLETIAGYLMLQAFHIQATPLMAAMLVIILNLSFAFPLTPGNLGIVQAVCVFLLTPFGVTHVSALAFGIGSQGITYLTIAIIGTAYFYRENMNLNLLGRAARESASQEPFPTVEAK